MKVYTWKVYVVEEDLQGHLNEIEREFEIFCVCPGQDDTFVVVCRKFITPEGVDEDGDLC